MDWSLGSNVFVPALQVPNSEFKPHREQDNIAEPKTLDSKVGECVNTCVCVCVCVCVVESFYIKF
jgi:hypothetical protein